MNAFLSTLTAITASAILAGCGGGNSGSVGGGLDRDLTYNQLIANGRALSERHDIDEDENDRFTPATPIRDMPKMGSATYNGIAVVTRGDGAVDFKTVDENGRLVRYRTSAQLAGTARLTADFDKGTLSGDIIDFKAHKKSSTKGEKLSYDGRIQDNLTDGRFTGKVDIEGENIEVDIPGKGGFVGPNADAVAIFGGSGPVTDRSRDNHVETELGAEQ